ncbi:cystatin-B-like [Entelurus aequoreus]|uniref:cystatin-B-like n=1 Tax=Entelurus aequoreus TaxID=161455 RepID=UPI002B1E4635|nr:cystatin-B-like [Entelurus aequoreus]
MMAAGQNRIADGLTTSSALYKKVPLELNIGDANVQQICDKVKPDAEKKAGKPFEDFTAMLFRFQAVKGTNSSIKEVEGTHYSIKVHVGGGKYVNVKEDKFVHLFVFQPRDGKKLELGDMQQHKSFFDPIELF